MYDAKHVAALLMSSLIAPSCASETSDSVVPAQSDAPATRASHSPAVPSPADEAELAPVPPRYPTSNEEANLADRPAARAPALLVQAAFPPVSAVTLQRQRAYRAALERLRSELDALSAEERERTQARLKRAYMNGEAVAP